MKVVLVYPEFPDSFWSFKRALKFVAKKASIPPLGLLTVAALLPPEWEVRLVDLNIGPLTEKVLRAADMVFISAISIQKKAARAVIERCVRAGVPVVAGGPLFSMDPGEFPGVSHFVLDEAEATLPPFLDDLRQGRLQRVYRSAARPDLRHTPLPRWDLIKMRDYVSMNIQYSRGCPFNCEFCDITLLYGREARTKETAQVLAELEALYRRGWRGPVFFVDDNFIGNKRTLKDEVLPAVIRWMRRRGRPFVFNTQVSINLADDPELMRLMTAAGFTTVFVGIETPVEASLAECDKVQNKRRDLLASVRTILGAGLEVQGGFIVGFDNDPPEVFDRQIAFIQESGIVTAMVGLLNAIKGTRLYQRMQQEQRLLTGGSGDNTDGSLNFIPRMEERTLREGYRRLVATLYAPRQYYRRIRKYLEQYRPSQTRRFVFKPAYLMAFLRSIVVLGIVRRERVYYWRLLFWTLFRNPQMFAQAITFAIYGYHFRKVFQEQDL
jgi:radical SAM superfamily enzyme YgiQ (UPF0313 family)